MAEFAFEYWNRVWDLLDSQNMSLKDLSESIGVSYGVVRQWKTKNRYPKADLQIKIASCLGTSVEYLMTGTTPAASPPTSTSTDYVDGVMQQDPVVADILASLIRRIKGEE